MIKCYTNVKIDVLVNNRILWLQFAYAAHADQNGNYFKKKNMRWFQCRGTQFGEAMPRSTIESIQNHFTCPIWNLMNTNILLLTGHETHNTFAEFSRIGATSIWCVCFKGYSASFDSMQFLREIILRVRPGHIDKSELIKSLNLVLDLFAVANESVYHSTLCASFNAWN